MGQVTATQPKTYTAFESIAVLESNHNVHEVVPDISPEIRNVIITHYFMRAMHCPGAVPGSVVAVRLPVAELKTIYGEGYIKQINKFTELISWLGHKTGIKYVVTGASNDVTIANKVLPADEVSPFPLSQDVPESAYYPTIDLDLSRLGVSRAQVEQLNHKGEFGDLMQRIQTELVQQDKWEFNFYIPQERIVGIANLQESTTKILDQATQMYAEITAHATEAEAETIAQNCRPGVVIRLAMSGGGYGSIFIKQTADNRFWLAIDGKAEVVDLISAVWEKLEQDQILSDSAEYVVSRMVDIKDSPSIGVYLFNTVEGKQAIAMPMTYQFMVNGSCKGGGSQTAVSLDSKFTADQEYIQAVTAKACAEGVSGTVNGLMHIGFDDIRTGAGEAALLEVINRSENAHLNAKYGHLIAGPHALVESNTRYTSLSLSVWPIMQYLAAQYGESMGVELLQSIYGKSDKASRVGGFAVWDYVKLPAQIQHESDLLSYIEQFNALFEQWGIFLLPRIAVETKPGQTAASSLVVGMRPTSDPIAKYLFKQLVYAVNDEGIFRADATSYLYELINGYEG
jgi:hypothetical protein